MRLSSQVRVMFGKPFSMVSAPGVGVLTVEATLTSLQSSRLTIEDLRDTA